MPPGAANFTTIDVEGARECSVGEGLAQRHRPSRGIRPELGWDRCPCPFSDATPRPDSRPSVRAATEKRRLPRGAPVAAASSCSSSSGAAAYTDNPARLQPQRPDRRCLATVRMRPTLACCHRHRWSLRSDSNLEKCAKAHFLGPGWSVVKVAVR